ncbi:MAG: M23 family metallopeptidase [Thermotogae bacterium]|nr:M23 family metallopeptidase [Thermotogota bacterium]
MSYLLTRLLKNSSKLFEVLTIFGLILAISSSLFGYVSFTYTVQRGDTLSAISKRFGVLESSLIDWNNGIDFLRLKIGQKIKILYPEGYIYKINHNDTLYSIAKYFFTDPLSIAMANGFTTNKVLRVGEEIFIPKNIIGKYFNISGKLIWPVYGEISSPYGWRIHPITGKRQFHTGVDIAAPEGVPIFAPLDGVITYTGWRSGYGLTVEMQSKDFTFRFGHMSKIDVYAGQTVKQGNIIGRIGNTGISTGPHLHFEVRYRKDLENPLAFLPTTPFKYANLPLNSKGVGGN